MTLHDPTHSLRQKPKGDEVEVCGQFDATEWKSLGVIVGGSGAVQAAIWAWLRKVKEP